MRCSQCGLVYQTPRPSLDQIGALYPPSYEPFQPILGDQAYVPKDIRRTATFVNNLRPRGGLLLDVGCGSGDFLMAMRRLFSAWRVSGVEPNALAVERAQLRDLPVQLGSLEDVPTAPQPDVITLWNVLEHLSDPRATLHHIAQRLAPGGWLCLAVPVHDSWDARIWGPYWVGWELPRHLYAFDQVSIRRLLEAAGFEIIQQGCVSGTYHGTIRSALLAIEARVSSYALRRVAEKLLYSQLMRGVVKPYMVTTDWAGRGTVLTIAARRAGDRP